MSMRRPLLPGGVALAMCAAGALVSLGHDALPAEAAETLGPARPPALGQPADPAFVTLRDISIGPDGARLPPGRGSVREGAALYDTHCAACHGANGRGGPAGDLVGGIGSLAGAAPRKTVGSYWPYATTMFDYVRRAMPYWSPGSLSYDEVYAVTAYVLHENGLLPADATLDAVSIRAVEMPNRSGFIPYWPEP